MRRNTRSARKRGKETRGWPLVLGQRPPLCPRCWEPWSRLPAARLFVQFLRDEPPGLAASRTASERYGRTTGDSTVDSWEHHQPHCAGAPNALEACTENSGSSHVASRNAFQASSRSLPDTAACASDAFGAGRARGCACGLPSTVPVTYCIAILRRATVVPRRVRPDS